MQISISKLAGNSQDHLQNDLIFGILVYVTIVMNLALCVLVVANCI